jgi:chemotaxis protein MotA
MFFLYGLVTAAISIILCVLHLQQDLGNYFDFVGMLMVLGGSVSVLVMIFPWQLKNEIRLATRVLFKGGQVDLGGFNRICLNFVERHRGGGGASHEHQTSLFAEKVLSDGAELLQLGFTKDKIARILEERIYQWTERMGKVSGSIRSLAKYPPAFGLVGTVLGLVSLMRAISQGTSSNEAGLRMAVALVATLYGLLTANLLLNPAGERVGVYIYDEKKAADLALQAVLMAADSVSMLEAQEVLNSYVKDSDRINVIGGAGSAAGLGGMA